MNPIAFNTQISQELRTRPQIALAVLPIGLMFSSFAPLWLFADWLSQILGIPAGAPVKDQPNGLAWIIIFLAVMVVFMITGYLLGWIINALVMQMVFDWPREKVRQVFLYSEVPSEWRKNAETTGENTTNKASSWAVTRQKGRWHFVLQRGVFAWGVPMYVFMACLPAMKGRVKATAFYFAWEAVLWGCAGALFGLVIWHLSERSFLNKEKQKS